MLKSHTEIINWLKIQRSQIIEIAHSMLESVIGHFTHFIINHNKHKFHIPVISHNLCQSVMFN